MLKAGRVQGVLIAMLMAVAFGDLLASLGGQQLSWLALGDTPFAFVIAQIEALGRILLPPPPVVIDARAIPLLAFLAGLLVVAMLVNRAMTGLRMLQGMAIGFLILLLAVLAHDAWASVASWRPRLSSVAEIYGNLWGDRARFHVDAMGWNTGIGRAQAAVLLGSAALVFWVVSWIGHFGLLTAWSGGKSSAAEGKPSVDPTGPFMERMFRTQDREFLPASIEILATPPSPVATSLLIVICVAFASALAWSYLSWIDIHAVAPGKIQPSGRSKVVQPLEPGKVVTLFVENGTMVRAGDLLVELDSTETLADRDAQAKDHEAAEGEAARRLTAISAVQQGRLEGVTPRFPVTVGREIIERETTVLNAELRLLRASVDSLKAQIAEKVATRERLQSSIAARQKLIALAKERVGMREDIESRGSGSRAMVIEALTQFETQITTDASERGQLLEVEAALISLTRKSEEALSQFVADQAQKLAEIDRKRERLFQEVIKAQSKSDRTRLKAPIDGTVQQLSVTTVGQVVGSGQSLMTVVPADAPIEVEVLLPNKDIGFVRVGQPAVIKIDAFPFTQYGTVDAEVLKVSRDAVEERDAGVGDASSVNRQPSSSPQPSSRTQALVFPVTLRLAASAINFEGESFKLNPGMAVTAEIKTGRRRALSYILSPLKEIVSQTARER